MRQRQQMSVMNYSLLKALELGGTMSGEHGIGMDKKVFCFVV